MIATLTERQQFVLDKIVEHFREEHAPPSTRDLLRRTGISSPNGINVHKKALIRKGVIQTVGRARRIALVGKCPCCGK